MPTPRPIIVPSVGATVGTSTTCPSSPIALRPATTPMIATVIGSDIATAVPRASRRIAIAAAIPIRSLDSVLGFETSWPR